MNIESLAEAARDVLGQGLVVLEEVGASRFVQIQGEPYNASVGQHYRHVMDHFLCLEKGIFTGEIDYDKRERDSKLETDIGLARTVTHRLVGVFGRSTGGSLGRECNVRYSVAYGNAQPVLLPTTVARELAFCVGHAVHHYAIIRLLCESLGVEVATQFGVAPSTLKFRSEQIAG